MPFAAIGGLIAGGGALLAAHTQTKAAEEAGSIAARGTKKALKGQERMYQEGKEALQPYQTVGTGATYSLANLFGLPTQESKIAGLSASEGGPGVVTDAYKRFMESPMYQLPLQQGMKAVEYARTKIGGLRNPGSADALMKLGQTYAVGNFKDYVGQLQTMANMGANAAGTQANMSTQTGTAMANTTMAGANAQAQAVQQAGQATASGYVGAANAVGGAFTSYGNNLMAYNLLNQRQSQYAGIGYGMTPTGFAGNTGMPGWIQPNSFS